MRDGPGRTVGRRTPEPSCTTRALIAERPSTLPEEAHTRYVRFRCTQAKCGNLRGLSYRLRTNAKLATMAGLWSRVKPRHPLVSRGAFGRSAGT